MGHRLSRFVLPASVLALITLGLGAVSPAFARCLIVPRGTCGGPSSRPCSCGNRVLPPGATLTGSLNCPQDVDGLFVGSGVTLDLNGATIQGLPGNICFSSGIVVDANATDVIVKTGAIQGFEFGVEATRGVTMSQFARLRIDSGFTGILLDGRVNAVANNDIAQNILTGGAFDGGIVIRNGVDNTVRLNQASGTDGNGIVLLQGSGNKVLKNVVRGSGNVSFGFSIVGGERACVRWNQGIGNTNPGISISGFEHTVRNNTFKFNVGGDCNASECMDCTITQNNASDGSCPNVVNPNTPSCP